MVLSDIDIREAIKSGEFGVSGLALDLDEQIQCCSVDLRIGDHFQKIDTDAYVIYLDQRIPYRDVSDRVHNNSFIIFPQEFILARTIETVSLAPSLIGFLTGRSSIGRAGLFIENAGLVDDGFTGTLTLELYNASQASISIPLGFRVCTLSLHRLQSPGELPYGHPDRRSKYQHQQATTGSRSYLDVRK